MIAAVEREDGIVWGLGSTDEEALADAAASSDGAVVEVSVHEKVCARTTRGGPLEVVLYEVSDEQARAIKGGTVSWAEVVAL